MFVEYSTKSISAKHSFESWRHEICSHLINAQARPIEQVGFDGSFKYSTLGGLDISVQRSMPHSWKRTAECLRLRPGDDYWLGFMEKGKAYLEQNGHKTVVGDGQFVLYDAAKTFNFDIDTKGMHIVRLPRALIERRVPKIGALAGKVLDAQRPGVSTLRTMLLEASSAVFDHAENPSLPNSFAETLFDLLVMSINLQTDQGDRSKQSELFAKVVSYIRLNLGNPMLSLEAIAEAHHVSTRTITRLFVAYDRTPMSFVWHERLISCKRVLMEGRASSVTQIAVEHGFSDMSHFSQSFRKTFGCSPSSLIGA